MRPSSPLQRRNCRSPRAQCAICRTLSTRFRKKRVAAEAELAKAKDQVMSERVAKRIDEMLGAATKASEALQKSLLAFVQHIGPLGLDGELASSIASQFREQVDGLARMALRGGQEYREGIISGRTQLPQALRPNPEKSKPSIEREAVYTLEGLRWKEAGKTKTAAAFRQVDLPVALIPRALKNNLVDRFSSPRTSSIIAVHGTLWGPPPDSDDRRLIDLDAVPEDSREAVA